MVRFPETSRRARRIGGRAIARLIKTVARTSSIAMDPPDLKDKLRSNHPLILAVWHGQFMMVSELRPAGTPVSAMVARHGDAELIGEAMLALDVELIRGAGAGGRKKDRGGHEALRGALEALRNGSSVVMTADVPPGPARRAGEGIVTIARMSGRPIVPVAVASSRYRALSTWSRMTINLPYSQLGFAGGEPVYVPRHASPGEIEAARLKVEQLLNAATRRAYELAGADPTRATPPHALDRDAPLPAPGLSLKTYRVLTGLFRPLAPALLSARERAGKENRSRRDERVGKPCVPRPPGRLIWVHAASVGETNAILPVIDRLRAARPDASFLLTTGTLTSAALAERRLGARATHQFVPLDTKVFAERFLDHWRPDLAVFTESEIWPNLILETSKRAVPLALVNARMSARSMRRWRRLTGLSLPLFSRFAVVLAQNDRLARGFLKLGARRVEAAGNIKIDAPPPPVDPEALSALRATLGTRPLFLAASTHEGEEDVIATVHRQLAARPLAGLCTIIAPRHPERGIAIAERLRALGLRVALRSAGELPAATTEVYIADTIGELGTLYSLAPVAFIGGSLVPHGGQNPIEAVRHGAAVLTGPHFTNFADAYTELVRCNGAVVVRDAGELAAAVARLLNTPGEIEAMRRAADAALNAMAGALAKTVAALLDLLPAPDAEVLPGVA